MTVTKHHKISKVLIANRAEIASRVQRACTALGIDYVQIASEADVNLPFARDAKTLEVIGPPPPAQSYLSISKIIEAAQRHKCDAVHPGYGFLSENAQFASAVRDAGLTFIGPSPESIETLGSKTAARARAQAVGVPTTPGAPGGLKDAELVEHAERIGFPVIIKAVGGGGGRGMRVVNSAEELRTLLPRARAETLKNFSSEDVYIERYIHKPRHIEVQIFGDHHGTVLHFGTRDCSTQRRHQKLIEEAPAPNLNDSLREQIHTAAVNAAKSVGYVNAGTAEFLLDGDKFYFLEMNTRIQVEHPATEEAFGVDLVQLQLKIAQGEKLPFKQSDIKPIKHAIEFRVYGEDPRMQFRPSVGMIHDIKRVQRPYLREEYGYEAGNEITVFYDAMLSKLIVTGRDRAEAIRNSREVFRHYSVSGPTTTNPFHRFMLRNPLFISAPVDIGYVDRELTAAMIDESEAGWALDPRHRAPVDGMEVIEHFRCRADSFDTDCVVELLHHREGYFVATPLSLTGVRAPARHCRASNGMSAALAAIRSEVIEKVSPDQLFNKSVR